MITVVSALRILLIASSWPHSVEVREAFPWVGRYHPLPKIQSHSIKRPCIILVQYQIAISYLRIISKQTRVVQYIWRRCFLKQERQLPVIIYNSTSHSKKSSQQHYIHIKESKCGTSQWHTSSIAPSSLRSSRLRLPLFAWCSAYNFCSEPE